MRDIYQLLREKELEIARVRQEIEALRSSIPLLEDEDEILGESPYHPLRAGQDYGSCPISSIKCQPARARAAPCSKLALVCADPTKAS